MNDDRLLDDDDLNAAFRSIRDTYDGTNPEASTTLHRALFRTRARERKSRFTRWVVIPIAAVLAASTAWAGVTGKLTPAAIAVLESFHAERTQPAPSHPVAAAPAASAAPSPAPIEETPEVSEPPTAPVVETVAPPPPAPVVVASAAAPRPTPNPPSAPSAEPARAVEPPETQAQPAPSASAPDPHAALFAEAHRLHFIDRDPARALAAWDRYLAVAPDGRFSPEARYNRALSLVRLGRRAEAQAELAAFANGTYGSYRRDEAKALLDALTRDASQP